MKPDNEDPNAVAPPPPKVVPKEEEVEQEPQGWSRLDNYGKNNMWNRAKFYK